jgi:hypothetical protein
MRVTIVKITSIMMIHITNDASSLAQNDQFFLLYEYIDLANPHLRLHTYKS